MRGRSATAYVAGAGQLRRQGILRAAIVLITVLIVAGYVSPVKSYIERSRQIASERAAAGELKTQHDKLITEKAQLQDNTYVEQVARRDLGLVKPGEQPFVLKDLNQGKSGSGTAAAAGQGVSAVDSPGEAPVDETVGQPEASGASFLDRFLYQQLP